MMCLYIWLVYLVHLHKEAMKKQPPGMQKYNLCEWPWL